MPESPVKHQTPPETSAGAPADAEEKAFLKAHRNASFWSSTSFGLASASYFGALSTITLKLFDAFEQSAKSGKPVKLFESRKTPLLLAGMVAFGSACMFVSNWLETKKTLLEWRMGGSKIGSKLERAAKEAAPESAASGLPLATPPERADGRSWVDASRTEPSAQQHLSP